MAIQTLYRVEVTIPESILDNGFDKEYDRSVIKATSKSIESGSDSYGKFEYAIFTDMQDAIACEEELIVIMGRFETS